MHVNEVLGIVSTSLGVIQRLGNTPGINLIPYVNLVSTAAGALHTLIDAGQEFAPLALKLKDTFKKDAPLPSDDEMAALRADTKAELDKLRAMPPREDGEPD